MTHTNEKSQKLLNEVQKQNRELKKKLDLYKSHHLFAIVSGIDLSEKGLLYRVFCRYRAKTGWFSHGTRYKYVYQHESEIESRLYNTNLDSLKIWFSSSEINELKKYHGFMPGTQVVIDSAVDTELKKIARVDLAKALNALSKKPINI